MFRNACVIGLIGFMAAVAHAQAQPQSTTNSSRPGFTENGRFFGFVPAHERVMQQRNVQLPAGEVATTSTEQSTRPIAPKPRQDTNVQQASYVDGGVIDGPIVGDALLPSDCGCNGPCDGGCHTTKLFGSAEYLYWWTKGSPAPALATTSPDGTDRDAAGVLPDASVLFGNDDIQSDGQSGGRFSLGMWLNPEQSTSLQVTYLFIADDESFSASSDNFGILARPFFNVSLPAEDSRLIVFPDLVTGNMSVNASTDFGSFEVLLKRANYVGFGNSRSELLFGYRRADLNDVIQIDETTTSLATPTLDTQFDLFDRFETDNEFHGAVFGLDFQGPTIDCWSINLLAKVAVGNTTARYTISGQTTTTTSTGDTSTVNGGLLAQDSNIGTVYDNEFSTLSEVGVTLRRQMIGGLSMTLGYTFLHWSDVARAAEQIDVRVNETQIAPNTLVGEALPQLPRTRSDFWAQGIRFGIEYRF